MGRQKRKRLVSAVMALLLTLVSAPASEQSVVCADEVSSGHYLYFGQQLPAEARQFYDAMYQMYETGLFQTGVEGLNLVDGGYVTQEQLESYADGSQELLLSMGAARDAFYADYPEIFYVDFSKLSLRVTTDGQGQYQAYLGTGRAEDYFVEGFQSQDEVRSAITAYEKRIDQLAAGANALQATGDKSLEELQVTYVHDQVIQNTVYRLEDNCTAGNAGHIRTAYGALVKGESLCEGYARAMKCVLDRIGIPCVLVQGMYQVTDDQPELHMWNYVQIKDQWYALDATADDRENGTTDEYLLVGEGVIGVHHNPGGILSSAGFEFNYPKLSGGGLQFEVVSEHNGLVVEYRDGAEMELETGVFRVSYNGMGYAKAAEQGKYIVGRTYARYPGMTDYECSEWTYMDPKPFALPERDDCLLLPNSNCQFVEFAVTELEPGAFYSEQEGAEYDLDNWIFRGDPLLFVAVSDKIENESGNYVPSPYAVKRTPVYNARMYAGQTYHVEAVFNERLIAVEGQEQGVSIQVPKSASAVRNSRIENFTWNGDTVTFDFTPSNMFADHFITYAFQLTGLVGEKTLKEPAPFTYFVKMKYSVCAYRSQGYYWNMFGRPALLESTDLSASGWVTSDGTQIGGLVEQRLALIASKPAQSQTDRMNQLIDQTFPDQEVLKSETYNIDLLYCNKKIVLAGGGGIRLSVGFPEGYGPEDEGVTFRAYHFRQKGNGIIDVEEVGCAVTKYGLILTCKSFSPFAVVAIKDDGTKRPYEKTAILTATEGGSISGGGMLTLAEGASETVTVQAQDGYVIEQIDMAGKTHEVTDPKRMSLEIRYEDLAEGSTVVEAKFVAESVLQKEQSRGETAVVPRISEKAVVNYPPRPEKPVTDGTAGESGQPGNGDAAGGQGTSAGGQPGAGATPGAAGSGTDIAQQPGGGDASGGQAGSGVSQGQGDAAGGQGTSAGGQPGAAGSGTGSTGGTDIAQQPGSGTQTPPVNGEVSVPVNGTVTVPVTGAVTTGQQPAGAQSQSNAAGKVSASGVADNMAKHVGAGGAGMKQTQGTSQAVTAPQNSGMVALTPVTILLQSTQTEVAAGGALILDPQVLASGGTDTYQWYKNDGALAGQTEKTLTIASVTEADAGSYVLEVTTTAKGAADRQVRSEACVVTVTPAAAAAPPAEVSSGEETDAETPETGGMRAVLIWAAVILCMIAVMVCFSLFAERKMNGGRRKHR